MTYTTRLNLQYIGIHAETVDALLTHVPDGFTLTKLPGEKWGWGYKGQVSVGCSSVSNAVGKFLYWFNKYGK